jgi:hypothetical protein
MEYLISDATASKLRDLIGPGGGTGPTVNTGSAHRQVAYVKCVSWNATAKTGTGQVAQRDAGGWTFTGTAGDMLLLAANDEALSVDKQYPALRFGQSGTKDIFVAFKGDKTPPPELACGLKYDDDGKIQFDNSVVGQGLKKQASPDCGFYIDPGCHITLEGGEKVGVRTDGLAGNGLKVGTGLCPPLEIKAGCGITTDSNGAVTVFSPDVAGFGLQPGATPCQLDVKAGCGIAVDSSGVKVNNTALAGNGLVAVSSCQLAVNTGCGIKVEDGKVKFDNSIVGLGLLKDANGCNFQINPGCAITDGKVNVRVEDLPDESKGIIAVGNGTCKKLAIKQGCGITTDSNGAVTVFSPDVAGIGLQPGATPCQLAVKPGCGIAVDANGVRVNAPILAGNGLVPSGSCTLNVNPGCGIKVEDDQVKFDNSIVGQGLRKSTTGCGFDIDPGCGITLEGGAKIGVHTGSLIGDGLTAGDGCKMKVKAGTCITVDDGGVNVNTAVASSTPLITLNGLTLSASGWSVTLNITTTPVSLLRNSCGLVVGVVTGTSTTSTSSATLNPMSCINVGDLCNYCVGYGTYGGGGTPGGTGYCWDAVGKLWVACTAVNGGTQ